MISSFDKYIKAAVDAKKYDVVCEMANVIYPERHINIMTYPGDSVRVYKNREDEVQVLCPKNISVVQESNLTKSISTGTIFDDADNVDNHADFIVGTKMPTNAMNNKGLENPYKLKEVVGSTIGVMDDDGRVDVSDTDVENGKNVIDDLLEKDSKEFKDVKNVVDDYLGNDDHSFGYDKDFTMDIQQLRDEIQRFKDSDISPEDSIQDSDWDDNWGSVTSIMDDDDDNKENPDTSKDKDDDEDEDDDHEMDISDDDDDQKEFNDDDESVEESFGYRLKRLDTFIEFDVDDTDEDISMEEYFAFLDTPPEDLFQESVIHSMKTLNKLGYDHKTKTFITDIPSIDGKDKLRCKLQIGGIVYGGPLGLTPIKPTGPTFYTPPEVPEPLLYVPLSVMLKGGKDLLSLLKHEEGHFYISTNRANFDRDFARARKLVDKHSSKLSDHGNVPEEYVADLYSANQTGVENTVKMLKNLGFKTRKDCAKLKLGLNHKWVTRFMKQLRRYENYDSYNPAFVQMKEYATKMKQCVSNTKEMVDYVTEIHGVTKAGPGAYASRLNNMDRSRVSALQAGRAVEKSVTDTSSIVSSIMKTIERQSKLNSLTFDDWEKMLHASINEVHKRIDEFKEANDYEIRARIAFIRKYGNKATQESVTLEQDCSFESDEDIDDDFEMITQEAYYAMLDEAPTEFIQEGAIKTLRKIGYDPRTKTFITDIPEDGGTGAKKPCKIKFDLFSPIGAHFNPDTSTIHIPIKDLLGNTDLVISTLKHEEGHFYISLDRKNFSKDFARAKKLVDKHGSRLSDHENAREEYVADLYSANTYGVENRVKQLKQMGYAFRIKAMKTKKKINPKYISRYFAGLRSTLTYIENNNGSIDDHSLGKTFIAISDMLHSVYDKFYAFDELIETFVAEQNVLVKPGAGSYADRLNSEDDKYRNEMREVGNKLKASKKNLSTETADIDKELVRIRAEMKKLADDIRAENKSIKDDESLSIEKKREYLRDNKYYYKRNANRLKNDYAYYKNKSRSIAAKLADLEKRLIDNIDKVYSCIDESVKVYDNSIKARIAFVRKYANKSTQESVTPNATMSNPNTNTASPNTPPPAYKTNQQSAQPKMLNTNNNNGANTDTNDIDYKQKEDEDKAKMNANPSDGSNVNTTMEEDTTTPMPMFSAGAAMQTESNKIKDVDPGDDLNSAPSDNRAPIIGAAFKQEAFGLKRPKKLKAIPVRDIVAYVTVEMNAIKDSNDQAMLSGYVCSKLELIDFYLNVIDTNDDRYVVPHTRQYLVDGQKQLTDLLTRILRIKPINRSERIWKINLPDNM